MVKGERLAEEVPIWKSPEHLIEPLQRPYFIVQQDTVEDVDLVDVAAKEAAVPVVRYTLVVGQVAARPDPVARALGAGVELQRGAA